MPIRDKFNYHICVNIYSLCALLNKHALGTGVLALSIKPFQTCSSARLFWVVTNKSNSMVYALIVDEIGAFSHQVTAILFDKFSSEINSIIHDNGWLKSARSIEVQIYGADEGQAISDFLNIPDSSASTQFIADLLEGAAQNNLSKNARRNIKKASSECTVIKSESKEAIDIYINLVSSSDVRRSNMGRINARHQHADLSKQIELGCAQLYFAQCGEDLVSAVRVSIIEDRAYYIMGGSSTYGFSIGASAFLLYSVMQNLRSIKVRSLTMGLANTEGLKNFKLGLGAKPIGTIRYNLPVSRNRLFIPFLLITKIYLSASMLVSNIVYKFKM